MYPFKHSNFTSLTSYTISPIETIKITQLNNELEDLEEDKECKKQLLQLLDDQLDAAKAELEAQVELGRTKAASVKEQIKKSKVKADILLKYIQAMENEDLMINKIKKDVDRVNTECWNSLKPTMQKNQMVKEGYMALKEAFQKCMELQRKAQSFIALPH